MEEKTTTVEEKTTVEPTPGSETKSDASTTVDDTSNKGEDAVDYKALLAAEEAEKLKVLEKLKQAEYTLRKKNEDKKNQKSNSGFGDQDEEEADEEDDDGHEEEIDVVEVVEQRLQEFKADFTKSSVKKEIANITSGDDEAKLVQFYYDNKIVKSGFDEESIKKDVETAHFLANKPRIEKSMKEISKKNISDEAKGVESGSGQAIEGDIPKMNTELTAQDKRILSKYGLKPEDVKS